MIIGVTIKEDITNIYIIWVYIFRGCENILYIYTNIIIIKQFSYTANDSSLCIMYIMTFMQSIRKHIYIYTLAHIHISNHIYDYSVSFTSSA